MAYALLSHGAAASTDSSNVTATVNTLTGTADLIVLVVVSNGNTPTLVDSGGNSWTGLTTEDTGADVIEKMYYVQAPIGLSTTHTFTLNSSGGVPAIAVMAFTGSASSPFDVQNGAVGTAIQTLATGSITPTQNNELVVSGLASDDTTPTINSSFILVDSIDHTATNRCVGSAYIIQTSAAAVNPTWHMQNSGSKLAVNIASFKTATPPDTKIWSTYSL